MTDADFLEEIIAQPDDDTPRLIYADWLEERGDPRGEFIRVECALARLPRTDPQVPALRARDWQLHEEHGARWRVKLPPLQGIAWDDTFVRGFVEGISIGWSRYLHADLGRVWEAAPVRRVRLTSRILLSDLVSSSHMTRVAALQLHLDRDGSGESALRILTGSPWITGLRTLELAGIGVGDAGAQVLASCPQLAGLTSLDTPSTGIGPIGARAILTSPHLAGLTSLNLGGNRIGLAGVRALVGSSAPTRLVSLHLDWTGLHDEGAQLLAAELKLPDLAVLHLAGNGIGDEGARALIHAPFFPRLTRLIMWENRVSRMLATELQERLGGRVWW